MAEQEQNRSEAATPYKIEEAKKKGSVAKSLEVNSLMAVVALLIVLYGWGWQMVERQLGINQRILSQAHQVNFELSYFMSWLNGALVATLYVLVPLFLVLIVVGILTNVAQTGPIFTLFPLKPDPDRINPISGFKRIFTWKLVMEAIKSVIKLALFGAVLYFAIKYLMHDLMRLMDSNPVGFGHTIIAQMSSIIFKLACVMALIALIDFMYTRWDYSNKLKMSRREVKEEVKRRDGDPRVRARIRELQRETLKRSKALGKVKDADVLITNPTHLAVAVKYVRGEMNAPQVLAKGAGELAGLMRGIARQHKIPVVENKKLARALFTQVDYDGPVPEKLYPDVARLLVWVYTMRDQKRGEAAT
jgi:flagellar biosynthetic protein FlhB